MKTTRNFIIICLLFSILGIKVYKSFRYPFHQPCFKVFLTIGALKRFVKIILKTKLVLRVLINICIFIAINTFPGEDV
jgi:hypothetical protein